VCILCHRHVKCCADLTRNRQTDVMSGPIISDSWGRLDLVLTIICLLYFSGGFADMQTQSSYSIRESGSDVHVFGDGVWKCQHPDEHFKRWNHHGVRHEHSDLDDHRWQRYERWCHVLGKLRWPCQMSDRQRWQHYSHYSHYINYIHCTRPEYDLYYKYLKYNMKHPSFSRI